MFSLCSVATAEGSKRWTCIRPTLPPLLELFFRSPVQRPQSWTQLNRKAKLPFPKVKDEAVQRIKHTIFPSLIWGQREGVGIFWLHVSMAFTLTIMQFVFPTEFCMSLYGKLLVQYLYKIWRGKQTALSGTWNSPIGQILSWTTQCQIGHFTVVCSVPWPLNRRKAGGDLVMLQTFLVFMCKSWYSHANKPVNMVINIWKTRR